MAKTARASADDFETSAPGDGDAELEFEVGENAEFISPPGDLRKKVKTRASRATDEDPVAVAEAALANMATSFDGWMAEETQRLAELWAEADGSAFEGEAREALYRAAHDIKGQAATLGFPTAGRVAASLCRLLEGVETAELLPRELVHQHVQSVRAIISEGARETSNAMAERLASRLDEVTDDYLGQVVHDA